MYLLLGTVGCHLCEQALALVQMVQQHSAITVLETDIAEESCWQADYALRIPVLYHVASGKALDWPFNATDVQCFINATGHVGTVSN
jgi:hypothetical protein